MSEDNEINALSKVYEYLKVLDNNQIKRIINWVTSKFQLNEEILTAKARHLSSTAPVEVSPTEIEPVPRQPGKPSNQLMPDSRELIPEKSAIKGFTKYDTFNDLLSASNENTVSSKILLGACYLQEKFNLSEFSSYDINSMLKKLGHRVMNISASINNLLAKKPPLLIQTGRFANTKKSRRKYRVTDEGLKIALKYLKK